MHLQCFANTIGPGETAAVSPSPESSFSNSGRSGTRKCKNRRRRCISSARGEQVSRRSSDHVGAFAGLHEKSSVYSAWLIVTDARGGGKRSPAGSIMQCSQAAAEKHLPGAASSGGLEGAHLASTPGVPCSQTGHDALWPPGASRR